MAATAAASFYRCISLLTGVCLSWIAQPSGIFGVPLNVSIKYANVAISLAGEDGSSFIYGYVPIVVAKCGVFLKENGSPCRFPIFLSLDLIDFSI